MKRSIALVAVLCLLLLSLTGCAGLMDKVNDLKGGDTTPTDSSGGTSGEKNYEGRLGDTLSTAFFDFTVTAATTADTYNGQSPSEGMKYLIADMEIQNTFSKSIPMGNYDFQIQWGGEGDEDFGYAIDKVADEQLEKEYELKINDSATGKLVFEVPVDSKDYSISYLEVYEDDSEGEVYFIFFSA